MHHMDKATENVALKQTFSLETLVLKSVTHMQVSSEGDEPVIIS